MWGITFQANKQLEKSKFHKKASCILCRNTSVRTEGIKKDAATFCHSKICLHFVPSTPEPYNLNKKSKSFNLKDKWKNRTPWKKPTSLWNDYGQLQELTLPCLSLWHSFTNNSTGVIYCSGWFKLHRLHYITVADTDLQGKSHHGAKHLQVPPTVSEKAVKVLLLRVFHLML